MGNWLLALNQISAWLLVNWHLKTGGNIESGSPFVSQVVLDECMAGDPFAASERLTWIAGFASLAVTDDANRVAKALIASHAIPATEPRDALHIGLAATHGLQYLLTWNFRHIANASTRALIEQTCRRAGYTPPTICTPDELLGR